MHRIAFALLLPLALVAASMASSSEMQTAIPAVCGDTTFVAENVEEVTNRFTASDSEFVQWRQENSLSTVAPTVAAAMVTDSTVCARVAHAVDSVMVASPMWSSRWSHASFARSYYEVGPYYVAIIAEQSGSADAGYFFWIFDRSTMAYLGERVPLKGI
jgi:hypothetical protein